MIRYIRSALAMLMVTLSIATPGSAASPIRVPDSGASALVDTAPSAAGAVLARVIYPASRDRAITAYTFAKVVEPTYRADPELAQLEDAHPGLIAAMIAAMKPVFEQGRSEALAVLWSRMGALYQQELDTTELRDAIAFCDGPTGHRLAALTTQAIAQAPSPGQVANKVQALPALSPSDAAIKGAFDATLSGRKLLALQPRIDAIIATWNDAPMPSTDTRIDAALTAVIARFGAADGDTQNTEKDPLPVTLRPVPR